jgi:uncharacterized membrane protein
MPSRPCERARRYRRRPCEARNTGVWTHAASPRDRSLTQSSLLALLIFALGCGYALLTPPFRTPDEVGHFYRAAAIAEGAPFPRTYFKGAYSPLPRGYSVFVRTLYRFEESPRYSLADLRRASAVALDAGHRPMLQFSTWYTPLPYAPQSVAALAGRLLKLRPILTFYLGRIANVAVAALLAGVAFRMAGAWRQVIAAVALFPMTLSQFGSWSADAQTIAVSLVVCALTLRSLTAPGLSARDQKLLVAASFALGLCKPVYFLIPLLIWTARVSIRRRAALTLAVAAGMALSVLAARHAFYNPRVGLPVDPAQQLQSVRAAPLAFVQIAARDFLQNGFYIEPVIGRLGYNDLKVPMVLRVLELVVLSMICVASDVALRVRDRAATAVLIVATCFGIALSQYLVWTIVGAAFIEGIQGRYFLPLAPLVIAALTIRTRLRLSDAYVIAACGALAAWGLLFVARTYWMV